MHGLTHPHGAPNWLVYCTLYLYTHAYLCHLEAAWLLSSACALEETRTNEQFRVRLLFLLKNDRIFLDITGKNSTFHSGIYKSHASQHVQILRREKKPIDHMQRSSINSLSVRPLNVFMSFGSCLIPGSLGSTCSYR